MFIESVSDRAGAFLAGTECEGAEGGVEEIGGRWLGTVDAMAVSDAKTDSNDWIACGFAVCCFCRSAETLADASIVERISSKSRAALALSVSSPNLFYTLAKRIFQFVNFFKNNLCLFGNRLPLLSCLPNRTLSQPGVAML